MTRRFPGWPVLGAWALALTVAVSLMWGEAVDFRVYRDAARYIASGGREPYSAFFSIGLPFTYPPFALLLFLPFATVPASVGLFLFRLASLLALTFTCRIIASTIPPDRRPTTLVWLLALTALAGSSPVRETLDKGQINLIVVAVSALALVRLKGFWSGFLIGVAGGVKLTPLALGVVYLKRRDWPAVAGVAAGAAASVGVGSLVLPRASAVFWTSAVQDPDRVGNVSYAGNASMRGVLDRLLTHTDASTGLWVGLSLVVVVAGYILIPRADDQIGRLSAVGIGATVMLLISPISWTHHWVWLPVLALAWFRATATLGKRSRQVIRLMWLVPLIGIVLGPLEVAHLLGFTGNEKEWPVVALGSWIPVATTLALLCTAALRWIRHGRTSRSRSVAVGTFTSVDVSTEAQETV